MGGEESDPGSRRMSRHSRRSLDGLRRSLDISRRKLNSKNHSSEEESELPKDERLPPVDITLPQTSYLLISPLLPPISMFATMFSNVGLNDTGNKSPPNKGGKDGVLTGKILTNYTTLAIYGDKDFFTSQRKLRKWVEHLAGVPESRFQFKEIRGAGHFWHEDGVEEQMRVTVREWVEDIVHSKGSG